MAGESEKSENTLFEEFSDILEKIASSLSGVQKDAQDIDPKDYLANISAQAAQQVEPKREVAPVKEEHKEKDQEERSETDEDDYVAVEDERRGDTPPQVTSNRTEPKTGQAERPNNRVTHDKGEGREEKKQDQQQAAGSEQAKTTAATETSTTESAQAQVIVQEAPAVQQDTESVEGHVSPEMESVTETTSAGHTDITGDVAEGTVEDESPVHFEETVEVETAETPEALAATPSETAAQPAEVQIQNTEHAPVTQSSQVAGETAQESSVQDETSADSLHAEGTVATSEELQLRTLQQAVKSERQQQRQDRDMSQGNSEMLARAMEILIAQSSVSAGTRSIGDSAPVSRTLGMVGASAGVTANSNVSGDMMLKRETPGKQAAAEAAKPLPKTTAFRTMERVESALKEVAKSRDGKTISVRLDPPDLGSVKIDVTIREGQLHARLTAESSQVSMLLRERGAEMQTMLRRMGLQVDQVTVAVHNEQFGADMPELFNQKGGTFSQDPQGQGRSSKQGAGTEGVNSGMTERAGAVVDHWVA